MSYLRALAMGCLVMSLLLSGCSAFKEKEDDSVHMSAEELFIDAKYALEAEEYKLAIRRLEAIQAMYPFSDYAEQAQLKQIYAYYANKDYRLVAVSSDRYIQLYPRSEDVDYAYYMKGLANFSQERGLFARMFPVNESMRDPGSQTQAYRDFDTLIRRFPDSQYAPDALQRMIFLRNQQAESELKVAEFYLERHMYVAAANRARYVIENYRQAPQIERALAISVIANHELGLDESAEKSLDALRLTYPNSAELQRFQS